MERVDTTLAILSDMHSGGSTALFLNRPFADEHQSVVPNKSQQKIYPVFEQVMARVAQARKNKRLIIVHNGDAIEGLHHNSIQMSLFSTTSQAKVHKELMRTFVSGTAFDPDRGDKLFYVRGTETHVQDVENVIGMELGAERNPKNDLYVYDHLEMVLNDKTIWFAHHGPKKGKGANEGGPIYNWLKTIYFDAKKHQRPVPDLTVTGHVHTAAYSVYVPREGNQWKMMHGIICPSFQQKTRFGYKVAAVDVNEIGAVFVNISADGHIGMPEFILADTTEGENIVTV